MMNSSKTLRPYGSSRDFLHINLGHRLGKGMTPQKEKRWRSENTREACDLPEILTGSLFQDWRGRVWEFQMSVIWYVSTNKMFKSKCGDTDPYRCHHVRRPKHVAHQRRYWRSSTLCASEWVRHWYARLSRVGLIATVQSAWSDTNNFQCFIVFLLICFYVYMYTYTHIILNTYIIYIHIYLCICICIYVYQCIYVFKNTSDDVVLNIFSAFAANKVLLHR